MLNNILCKDYEFGQTIGDDNITVTLQLQTYLVVSLKPIVIK